MNTFSFILVTPCKFAMTMIPQDKRDANFRAALVRLIFPAP